jgi:ligand-binding sensor domain-containing protein/two-component sensor histidine kinase
LKNDVISRVLLLSLLLIIIFPLNAVAISPGKTTSEENTLRYGISFWREAEGLPQSRIRAITQTRDGYLWLGTDNGVVRFNGTSFTAFTVETGCLKDNEVWSLLEDNEGGLWIGTYGGGLTLYRKGQFTTFTSADGLPDDVILQLDKDAEGNIWMATPSGVGFYSRGVFTQFTTGEGVSNQYINAINAHSPQGIFAGSGNKLYRFLNGKFNLTSNIVDESDGVIEQLLSGSDGSLWLNFSNAVIKKWKDSVITTYSRKQNLTSHVTALYEDSNRILWAALDSGLMQLRDEKFESVPLDQKAGRLGVIYSLFGDLEGNLWLGLQANGLGRLHLNELSTISIDNGLNNESTRTVFQDSEGTIWIGTANGFSTYRNGIITNYPNLEGKKLAPVRSIAEDNEGNIWIASGESLLLMKKDKLTRFPEWKGKFEIEVIYKDELGRMWIGTDGDGLFQYRDGKFINFQTQDGLASNHVRGILSDNQGNLWISCFRRGISKYSDGKFTSLTTSDGLAGNRVLALYQDDEGALWFATREGLSRFKDGKFFNYSAESGLLTGFIYTILDDGKGNFWFSCAKGLFRVAKSELKEFAEGKRNKIISVEYGVRDGMQTRAFNVGNQPAAWKAADGSLMFCSLKGLVIVNLDRISTSNFIPPVYIEKVLINREKFSLETRPQVPIGTGEVEIQFAALSYNSPEKLRFKYKLDGFDDEWIDAGTRRSAYYTNLPPGAYHFRVMAGNIEGKWNEEGAGFDFYLNPRFYQTGWFAGLMIATVLLIVTLLYRFHLAELKARYSAVLAERRRIAIEIHDTFAQNLAGIALQLDSVSMELADPDGTQESIDQACNLIRYSLSEARRAVSDLHSDELENRELITVLPEITNKMAANSKSRVNLKISGVPRKLNPAIEKNLLRIFQETLSNAIKHAEAEIIEIELNYGTESLKLNFRDDGKGFDTGKIMLEVGHYGLIGIRERVKRIGGHLILRSHPEEGTEVNIEIPFSNRRVLSNNVKL